MLRKRIVFCTSCLTTILWAVIVGTVSMPLHANTTDIDFSEIANEVNEDEEIKQLIRSEEEMIFEYNQWTLNHAKRVFMWNHISSVVIFFTVLIVIFAGLYFSYLQFQNSILPNKDKDTSASTVKLGTGGLEVSSSIIGLLILVISLAFLYLYLDNVYPVTVVSPLNEVIQGIEPSATAEQNE